jgi:hypothetical protein
MKKEFYYHNFNNILSNLHSKKINNIELELGISMETPNYNGKEFKKLLKNIKEKFFNHSSYFLDKSGNKFKINKFRILLADSLNKHNIFYKIISQYLKKNNISSIQKISQKKIEELKIKSLLLAKEQGQNWLHKNMEAINILMPKNSKLDLNFKIGKPKKILFEGNNTIPTIELISYDYYKNHPKYLKIKEYLKRICDLKNNIIQETFLFETNYFMRKAKKNRGNILFESFFKKQIYEYLFDEEVSFIIKHKEQNNVIELYYGNESLTPLLRQQSYNIFIENNNKNYYITHKKRGRIMEFCLEEDKDKITPKKNISLEIKNLFIPNNLLSNINKRKFVSIKLIEKEEE